ncbi:hypothetical protein BIU82_00225 [Arthrobacter sp. SW1]|nr:hypothetical protein BIU82_00225 [Arthrobacter sp. SW1]
MAEDPGFLRDSTDRTLMLSWGRTPLLMGAGGPSLNDAVFFHNRVAVRPVAKLGWVAGFFDREL